MIVGIDHLALSASDTAAAGQRLAAAGFEGVFVEHGIENAAAKRPLLARHEPTHDLALYRPSGGGTPIELTVHNRALASGRGDFMPLVSLPGDCFARRERTSEEPRWDTFVADALGVASVPAHWPGPECDLWSAESATSDAHVMSILFATPDPEGERRFLIDSVGCTEIRRCDGAWAWLRLAAPITTWRGDILLAGCDRVAEVTLDSGGFTCLALLSSDLDRDRERMLACGARAMTETFELTVNRRCLQICFCRTPGGSPIELICPSPKGRKGSGTCPTSPDRRRR